jgi:uncharacterized protein YndB with AHSA1/START domain
MDFVVRVLKVLLALVLASAVVLWFAAHRGDRGYIGLEVAIDRPAPMVFRWITSDQLLRRWISDLTKLEKIGSAGPVQANDVYRIDELIGQRRVALDVRVIRVIPNQELELAVKPAESSGGYTAAADFKLFPSGDYTRLVFTSHSDFESFGDQMIEPILTYTTKKKLEEDLTRLKLMIEAEPATQADQRGRSSEQ